CGHRIGREHRDAAHAHCRTAGGRQSQLPLDSSCERHLVSDVIEIDWRSGPHALTHLRAGDAIELTGRVLTLRDASAARIARALEAGDRLPVSLDGQILYAVGPSPAKPGQIIGSAGPTTTARMARYFPALFAAGVRAVIGKGELHGSDMTTF